MEKTYNIDIWYLRPNDIIRFKLVDYTIVRFVKNDDDFFLLMYNHYTNAFEIISEDVLNFKFRVLYTNESDNNEEAKYLFDPKINDVFETLYHKFKNTDLSENEFLTKFCKDFDTLLNEKNISLKEKIKENYKNKIK